MNRFAWLLSALLLLAVVDLSSAHAQVAQQLSAPSPTIVIVELPPGYEVRLQPRGMVDPYSAGPLPSAPLAPSRLSLDPELTPSQAGPTSDIDVLGSLQRRHRLARRAALWMPATAALAALGGAAMAMSCRSEADVSGEGCSFATAMLGGGTAATLLTGSLFVFRTNRESRAMRRAGLHLSRVHGILAVLFYVLPYTQVIGLALAARQMRINRGVLDQLEADGAGLQPKYF